MRLPSRARVLLRRALVRVFKLAALLRVRRVANGKLSTSHGSPDPVARELGSTAVCSSLTIDEPTPQTELAFQHGPDIQPRSLRTVHLIVETRDPRYSFRNNVTLDHRRRVIAEARSAWDELPVSYTPLESVEPRAGTVAYLSNTNVANFYHWIVLTLPLLRIYWDEVGVDPDAYYVGRPVTAWHRETLAMLNIHDEQIVSEGTSAERLVAAVSNRVHGAVDTASLQFVRERLGRPRFAQARTRRLFVGRGEVAFRRFVNESECFELLAERYGFEYVTMDGKSVAEEIDLFSSAECIVGVHGAALTNLLWAQPECKVLELVPYGWNHPGYQELAAFVGCAYGYVVGRADAPRAAGLDEPDSVRRENDLLIDPDVLERAATVLF